MGSMAKESSAVLVISAVDAFRLLQIKWVYFVSCPGWLMYKD